MHDAPYEVLFDSYFPFRLYADSVQGLTPDQLALKYGLSSQWIEERIEAARLCIQKQIRIIGLEGEKAA